MYVGGIVVETSRVGRRTVCKFYRGLSEMKLGSPGLYAGCVGLEFCCVGGVVLSRSVSGDHAAPVCLDVRCVLGNRIRCICGAGSLLPVALAAPQIPLHLFPTLHSATFGP